jgi:hypothetical protein
LRFTLSLVAAGIVWAAPADAAFTTRLADFESPATEPYDVDQVSTNAGTATLTSSLAYTGAHALRLTYEGGGGGAYARAILRNNGAGFEEGDDFWIGAAVYLEPGYYAGKNTYADILRLDSYVVDDGTLNPRPLAQNLTLASFSNGELYVEAQARTGDVHNLIGPLAPSELPEGRWNWVELHVIASANDGQALTALKINGAVRGESTLPNRFPGRRNWNRFRAGLVSSGNDAGAIAVVVDRMSISPVERAPAPAPTPTPSPTSVPAPPPTAVPDTTAPGMQASGSTRQKAGKTISIALTPSEAINATVTGSVSVRRSARDRAKSFRLTGISNRAIPANTKVTLKLEVSRKTVAAIRSALRRRGGKATAKITIRARDLAGNIGRAARTITLRR